MGHGQHTQQPQRVGQADAGNSNRPEPSRNMSLLSSESGVLGNPAVNEERSRSRTPQRHAQAEPTPGVNDAAEHPPQETRQATPHQTPPNERIEQRSDVAGPVRQVSARTLDPPSMVSRSTSVSADVASENAKETEPRSTTPALTPKAPRGEEENIYDATPRVKQDVTGNSQPISEVSKTNTGESSKAGDDTSTASTQNQTIHAELEDTNNAFMRTLRLDSQEEKIFYDPEGDVPKMTATSYPGQEWVPDFADWRDGE